MRDYDKEANPVRPHGAIGHAGLASEQVCETRAEGPRITMQDIEANIACEYSVNAGAMLGGGSVLARGGDSLHLLTVHFIVLKNGFTVIGKAAPVSEANFSPAYGAQLAREDAIRQVWPLMGYELRGRMPRRY